MDKTSLRQILVSYGIGFFGTLLPLLVISFFLGGSAKPTETRTPPISASTDDFFASDDDRFESKDEPTNFVTEADPAGFDSEDASAPPKVLRTEPLNGAQYVDAEKAKEIRITFDRDMNPTASWCEDGDIYPKTTDLSHWIDKRTCVLPVQLESGKNYALSLNNTRLTSFRSVEGIALKPVRIAFRTASKTESTAKPATAAVPKLVRSEPMDRAQYVNAANTREIRVVFDRDMASTDSWCEAGDLYPRTTGPSHWIDKRTCVLPVQLEPGKNYAVSLNNRLWNNFRSVEDVPIEPTRIAFRTEPSSDSPSQIPAPQRPKSFGPELLKVLPSQSAYTPQWKDDDWHWHSEHDGKEYGILSKTSESLKIVCQYAEFAVDWIPGLIYYPIPIVKGKKYRVEVELRSQTASGVLLRIHRFSPEWRELDCTTLRLQEKWKTYQFDFTADETRPDARLVFNNFEPGGIYEFRRVSFREIDPDPTARSTDSKSAARPVGVPGKDDPQNIPQNPRFWNKSMSGRVSFDYESNNGRCAIGEGIYMFETAWSSSSATNVYVYKDPPSIDGVAIAFEMSHPRQIRNAATLDFSSRTRNPRVGMLVVLRNQHGKYAVLGITKIVNKDRTGAARSLLEFTYHILQDGSDFGNVK